MSDNETVEIPEEEIDDPAGANSLIVQLMQRSQRDLAFTTNSLLDCERQMRMEAQCELSIVRQRLYKLLDGPYAPSSSAIERAIHPHPETIEQAVDLMKDKEGNF